MAAHLYLLEYLYWLLSGPGETCREPVLAVAVAAARGALIRHCVRAEQLPAVLARASTRIKAYTCWRTCTCWSCVVCFSSTLDVVTHRQLCLLQDQDACCKTRTLNVSVVPLQSLQTTVSISRAERGVVLAQHHLAYALAIC